MTTDTGEEGLEDIIFAAMTGAGWIPGSPGGYNREFCVDLAQLAAFLVASCAEPAACPGLWPAEAETRLSIPTHSNPTCPVSGEPAGYSTAD